MCNEKSTLFSWGGVIAASSSLETRCIIKSFSLLLLGFLLFLSFFQKAFLLDTDKLALQALTRDQANFL